MDVIRPRTDADIDACAAVLVVVHAADGYPVEGVADPRGWIVSDATCAAWVAERDGRVVGHVAVSAPQDGDAAPGFWRRDHPEEAVAVLGRLFVHPDARNGGLAAMLVKTAMNYGGTSAAQLVLDVMKKDSSAIRLYQRLNWKFLGETIHKYNGGTKTHAECYAAPPAPL